MDENTGFFFTRFKSIPASVVALLLDKHMHIGESDSSDFISSLRMVEVTSNVLQI